MFKCFGLIASHLLQPSAYRQQKCKSSLDLLIAEIDLFVVSFLRLTSDTLAIIELALSTALLLRFLVRDDPSWSDPRLLNLLYFEKESLLEDIQHDGIVQLRGKILGYIKTSINKSGYGSSPGQLSEVRGFVLACVLSTDYCCCSITANHMLYFSIIRLF